MLANSPLPRQTLTRLATTLALVLLVLLSSVRTADAEPRYRRIQIIHTNDLHGHVENAAAMADVIDWLRRGNPDTLVLDGGDCITGTPLSTIFQGRPIFEVMSKMGYDAAVIGNHEFDHGWALIHEFQQLASFPLLCANAKDPNGKAFGDAPYRIFEVGDLKVGVIGLVTDDVPGLTTKAASAGCSFEAPLEAARRLVPEVRAKSDIVVLLTHIGVEGETALAGGVEGVDLVVGGHSHTELKEPLAVGDAWVVQAYCYGRRVGVVDIVWDTEKRRISDLQGRLVKIDRTGMPQNAEVKAIVDEWESRVEKRVGATIGKAPKRLGKKGLRRVLERIYRDTLGADFGFQNNGGIRANIEAGPIRIRDIWTVLPFDNTLVKIRLKGDQVPEFNRRILGSDFDPTREYVFATNSYVTDQQKKYFGTTDIAVEDTGVAMREAVVEWVRTHGGFEAPKGARVTASASSAVSLGPTYAKATDLTLDTTDGLKLAATYHPPKGRPARGAPSVVALHMYRSDRTAWAPLIPEFAKRGMGVLTIDLRGHGGSKIQGESDLSERAMDRDAKLFLAMHNDAAAGITWLREELGVPAGQIGLIGASVGCSVVIDAGARHADDVGAVATLTPGANYLGVPSLEHVAKWPGLPLLLVASEGERPVGADPLCEAVSTAETMFFPGGRELHGTHMFGQVVGVEANLARWLRGALAGVRIDGLVSDDEKALSKARSLGDPIVLTTGTASSGTLYLAVHSSGSGWLKTSSWGVRVHTASGATDVAFDDLDGVLGTASLGDAACEALIDGRLAGAKPGESVRVEILRGAAVIAPAGGEAAIEWRVP